MYMKKTILLFALLFASLAALAQDFIRVKYQGAKPTITDLAWAYANYMANLEETGDKPSNAILHAMIQQRKGLPQEEGVTFIIDEKNGYLLYERVDVSYVNRMEMCYWNEADGKHKLFAFNNMATFIDGRPAYTETSDLQFLRYNNATKKMVYCDPPGFEVDYNETSYALPRTGKHIVVTKWDKSGNKIQETMLKWNGRQFSK